jgi:uncharacterized protein (DUF433 family)
MGSIMIERKRGILGGKPIIEGTRISIQRISDYITAGYDVYMIQRDYPHLTKREIEAALDYIIDTAKKEKRKLEPAAA